ncbi:TfoX/Sxy family protein [Pseudoroseicyclus sp. H15]
MAYDKGVAELLRERLADHYPREQRMFGGLAFMVDGHMVACATGDGALLRPGKAGMDEALALPGVVPMQMGARTMGGFVLAEGEAIADEEVLEQLLAMSLATVRELPAKE